MKIILFLIIVSQQFCYSQSHLSQKAIDSILNKIPYLKTDKSLIQAYTNLSLAYTTKDTENGVLYGNKALALSKKINWNEGKANALIGIGESYYSRQDYNEAFKHYKDALNHTKNELTKGRIYRSLAATYNSLGNYGEASKNVFAALKISEKQNNLSETAKNYNTLGLTYFYTNQTTKAIYNFNKSLKLNTKLNLNPEICRNLQNIGAAHADVYENEEAVRYYEKALALATKIEFIEIISSTNFNLARLYVESQLLDKALIHIGKAKLNAQKIGNSRIYNASIITESEIYQEKSLQASENEKIKYLERSEELLLESIERAKINKSILNLKFSYRLLSDTYSLKNEDKIAKEYYILYADIQDSIYNSESKETIKNLEDQRIIDKKNAEIKINKISLEAKEKQKWFLVSGLAFLSVLGALLYFQNRTRKRNNEKLKLLNSELDAANKAKTRFFSILNHDLRGPVANLAWFLQMQKENPEALDEESKNRIQDKTILGVENLLISMEDMLQWSKSQMENFKPQPRLVNADQLFEDLQVHFSSVDHIKFNYEIDSTVRVTTDENYLKTILRNLTSNAIKALEGIEDPQIVWKAWQANEKTYFSIFDNGKGATNEQLRALYDEKESIGIKSGLGLHLIRDLGKAIDCSISVESKPNAGTTFVLELNS